MRIFLQIYYLFYRKDELCAFGQKHAMHTSPQLSMLLSLPQVEEEKVNDLANIKAINNECGLQDLARDTTSFVLNTILEAKQLGYEANKVFVCQQLYVDGV